MHSEFTFTVYVSTWTMGKDNIEAIKNIGEMGFRYVELWPEDNLRDNVKALCEIAETYGIRFWSLHAPFVNLSISSPDDKVRARSLEVIKEYIIAAGELGAKVVVVHPSSEYLPDIIEYSKCLLKLRTSLAMLSRLASEHDVLLALENMIDRHKPIKLRVGAYIMELRQLIEEMNLGNVGLCLDTGHSFINKMNPALEAYWAGKHLITTHIDDNHGERDDHLVPTKGKINWNEVLNALKAISYRGPLVMEIYSQGRPLHILSKIRELCKKFGLSW